MGSPKWSPKQGYRCMGFVEGGTQKKGGEGSRVVQGKELSEGMLSAEV